MRVCISVALVSLTVMIALACGCDGSTGDNGSPTADTLDAAPDAGDSVDAAAFGFGDGEAGAASFACSSDLQDVVDLGGNFVNKCPPEQGCAGGKCVLACAAAAAAKGTIGCDFVVATPSFYAEAVPPCFAVFVANSWSKPTSITVTRAGTSYDVTQFGRVPVSGQPATSWANVPASGLPPGQVAVLFMSSYPSTSWKCPVPKAVDASTAIFSFVGLGSPTATGRGQAFHIVTDVPVTAYDILPYGGAASLLPSAELLLPTTAWGTNYLGIVPKRGKELPLQGPQWGQIVGSVDNTTVTIVPNVALPGGTGVTAAPAGQVTTFTLNAGEYIQWQDSNEMSGTIISSDKPIGFNGGSGYDCYKSATSGGGGCDSAHQAIPPIAALGFDYVAPPFATRRADGQPESIPYRFVGAADGTLLQFDPAIAGAPAALTSGQVVDFESTVAFRATSQDKNHPFYVGQIMPGCLVTGGSRGGNGCLGDEEFVNILPPAQFLKKYIFFTDPTYTTTNLVFVRMKGAAGFADVNLDCFGNITGWQPVGASGQYEITNVDLVRDGTKNGTCDNGPHTATSSGPFGLMVWGLDREASYAYPAGGNVAPINAVVVPAVPK